MDLKKILEERQREIIGASVAIVFLVIVIAFMPLVSSPPDRPGLQESERFVESHTLFSEELTYYPMRGQTVGVGTNKTNITVGFATQDYELHFGRIPARSATRKVLQLSSERPALVSFHEYGNISPHVDTPDGFLLEGSKDVELEFNSTVRGNFSGTLVVKSLVGRNAIGRQIVELAG